MTKQGKQSGWLADVALNAVMLVIAIPFMIFAVFFGALAIVCGLLFIRMPKNPYEKKLSRPFLLSLSARRNARK